MALKFLNKKGWHTGSLRNLETVWKAEQKHEAEQRKLEELRKQIEEERERSEFRQLQEQAGLVPRQERLDFLYDSGLAVGKGSSNDGFRSAEVLPGTETGSSASNNKQSSAPGALFEEKPQSANDAWRKLHSDPLLLIRQREQDALAQIKNNPVKMAMIRKSVEEKKKNKEEEHKRKKHKHKKKKHTKYSSEGDSDSERSAGEKKDKRKRYRGESDHRDEKEHKKHSGEPQLDVGGDESEQEKTRKRNTHHREDEYYDRSKRLKHISGERSRSDAREEEEGRKSSHYRERDTSRMSRHKSSTESDPYAERNSSKRKEDKTSKHREDGSHGGHPADRQSTKNVDSLNSTDSTHHKRPPRAPKLSAEEKAARAREMQLDADVHEEERWKRLKKASEADAREAARNVVSGGRNFLDAAQKSIYGTEKGGSSSVEESVRRRAYYLQGRSSHDGNAFRR